MKRLIILALIVVSTLLVAGCASPVTTTPSVNPTAEATPTPMATAPQNITVTLPPGSPSATVTITHYITGTVTFNKAPTSNYKVLVDTDKGNQYGAPTDANGKFNVTFPDDGSATYKLKLSDSSNSIVYQDRLPRYLNATGPMNISIEVPATNQMNVTIT
jgi:hypothetical protein